MTQVDEFSGNIADPGIENALSCSIEAAPVYQLGQAAVVNGTLHNSGASAIWILGRNTFLNPDRQDVVTITRGDSVVPYIGPTVFHHAPNRESYILIPPGESISGAIDIHLSYDLSEPGNYVASFCMPIVGVVDDGKSEPPVEEASLQLAMVNSAKVSFRIDGIASNLRADAAAASIPLAAAGSLPSQPILPFFRGMNQQEMDKIREAHLTAYRNILVALASVKTTVDTDNYNSWFEVKWPSGRKNGWEKRREKVIATLSAMANHMATQSVTYAKEDPNKLCGDINCVLAYTYKGQGANIYFCPIGLNDDFLYAFPFYGARTTLQWDYSFIVTHEMSHSTSSTSDDWYSWYMCSQLAVFNPELAVTNAQNYALFVMRENGGDVPMNDIYMVKCFNQKNGNFLGWLQSDGNWVTLNGDNPNVAPDSGCVSVRWYEYKGEKFLVPTNSSRYIGDNGNGGHGNGRAAWNLWARANSVGLGASAGEIFIKSNPKQRLGIYGYQSKDVLWISDDAPPPYIQLRCEFQKI